MKASDTRLNKEQLSAINNSMPADAKYGDVFVEITKQQAERSFKAGIKEASEIYDRYVILLSTELNEVIGVASLHGWQSRHYDDGVKCRKEIDTLKKG